MTWVFATRRTIARRIISNFIDDWHSGGGRYHVQRWVMLNLHIHSLIEVRPVSCVSVYSAVLLSLRGLSGPSFNFLRILCRRYRHPCVTHEKEVLRTASEHETGNIA